ncbi:hypothetical protein RHS01_10846 [Rhizoctonia solani]|uniref:Uncharacterized protein n=1 Tax=Rhizoctonia solani TaxID=456999 RepID=A0A8H7M223_9AGAM|nr:hypothetical protein RHS01_10846 [Rhizoctonia solani]
MATRSRSTACPPSPLDQGELGPALPATADEPRSLKPEVYGEISLSQAISLILGLQNQVIWLEREIKEIKEVNKEAQDWMGAVDQTLTCIKVSGGPQPHTPEDRKPWQLRPRPGPYPKPTLFQRLVRPSSLGQPHQTPLTFAQPTPVRAPPRVHTPAPPTPIRLHSPLAPQPAAPVTAYQAPSRQWLTRMMAWVRLNQRMFPTDQEILSFLLMNMKDAAGAWAHPHLDQLGSHRALIQTVDKFRTEFLAAFGNPDATRAAERQIANLTQTERRPTTLLELQNAALVIDNALREERASHPPKGSKSGTSSTPNRGRVPANRPQDQDASPAIPILSPRRSGTAAGLKASASNAVRRATIFAECRTGWKATPKEEGVKKEAAKRHILIPPPRTAKALRLPLIDLPHPRTVTMLDGSSPQAGKIWKKANLTFSFDGKKMTKTFLICNTGSHAAILGLKWLDAHNPEIDWNQRTLSFPHVPPEHVAIAKEEEADKNPLEGVPPEYHQYAKVFGEEEFNKLPPHRHYDIAIKLTEEGPLNSPLYSMTDAKSATLKDWLRDKLKAGKIRPSKLSISSPVMFVPKKDGSRRLVLRGAKVFTKLDLRWGYNNVRVKEGDKWKTAFRTKYGLYKSLVMTFGLTNAPAAFQHFMNKLFKDLLDVCVIIYLDDILIYSKDDASHTQHVHEVLRRLLENQLFCKASKCTFHVTSVEYLGIIVSDKGFSLDKLKIQAVQEWPVPTKVKEVQLFLGFANFLRRFVANFSHMARPLHNLVRKDTPWKWDTREQEAFQGLKDAITNAPVLCHADPTKPYFLETDASGAALGSILSQRQEDGRLHPLGFLSESFKGAEQNYDTHDKELLAIIRSFEYWRIFLEGTKHPITIVYCPGKQSGKPDALSRRSDHADIPPAAQTMLPDPVFANIALVTPEKELQRQIEASLDQDESLEEILQFLQNESKAPPSIKRAFKDYEMEAGLLFYQG